MEIVESTGAAGKNEPERVKKYFRLEVMKKRKKREQKKKKIIFTL